MSAFRRVALVTTGLGFYVAASYSAYQIQRIRNKPSPPEGISEPAVQRGLLDELNSVYSGIASGYDSAIDYDEFWMGLGSKRRSLLSNAKVM